MAGASVGHSGQSLCFLSLDGGGVRGLSSLYILKAMVERIDPNDPPKPCNLFDMIGRTSTGGLIALMLGRLEMTVDECIDAYKAMSPQIFTKLHHRLNLKGKVQGRFDHTAIEAAVKLMLREKGLSEDTLLQESSSSSTKTQGSPSVFLGTYRAANFNFISFVCATSKQTGRTALLRTYHQKGRSEYLSQATAIWRAARATSAATSFFDPVEIGDEEFVDGATPANNTIMELWAEAQDYFSPEDNASWDLDDKISCLVSIGTGIPTIRPFGDDPVGIGAKLVKKATDTEKNAEEFARRHPKLHSPQRYFRFNVTRGLEGVRLEDHSKGKEIISATRMYIESFETSRMLMHCSASLSQTQRE